MENFICKTCGVEYAESESPPQRCPICEDPRQYVGWEGQQWTTMARLKADGYKNDVRREEPGLTGIGISPSFTIGQRALLVQTPGGNVLYDCISYLDDEAIAEVKRSGGIQAICLSHPHFYDSMVSWSRAFDDAPIYIPEADKEHVMRPDPAIRYWDGKPLELVPGVTLIQCGGHFEGSAVLHWAAGAEGRGALFVGDSMAVVPDRRFVSFMTSYPNFIPLRADEIQAIVEAVEPYEFDRIYGGWWDRNVMSGAKEAVRRSADRYIKHIGG
ncbi:MAG: MBL fold metallo-hydrolase [Chloroflexi bacterium]|nr:MBL fold metallo-hydrolase [Chloroflexota bacterium]